MESRTKDEEAGMADIAPPPYTTDMSSTPITSGGSPPSYNVTDNNPQPAGPPPSYESLYGKVKAAKAESSGIVEFFKKFFIILIGTLGCTVMLGVLLAIPIAMIVIGAIYKDDCKAERMIPIYLIVAGSFGIVKNLSSIGQRCKNRNDEDSDEKNAKPNPFDSLLNCFLFAWFIAGNVWIYRTHHHWSSDPAADNFCEPTLYYFAFWITTATYIMCGTMCCCICCCAVVAGCFGAKE